MAWITPLFVEPFYRLIYGRPSATGVGATDESQREGWCWSSAAWAAWTSAGSACATSSGPSGCPTPSRSSLGPRVRALVRRPDATSPTATRRPSGSPRRSGSSRPNIRATRSSWSPSRAAPASWSRPSSARRGQRGAGGAAGAGPLAALRPDRGAAGRAPGDGRLLVAAGRGDPGRGHAAVRHDRSGQDRRRGPGGFRVPGPDEPDDGAEARSTRSSARCAGGLGWPASAISAAISARIIRCSSGSTSCRCSARTSGGGPALNRGSGSSRPPVPPISYMARASRS